MFMQFSKAR